MSDSFANDYQDQLEKVNSKIAGLRSEIMDLVRILNKQSQIDNAKLQKVSELKMMNNNLKKMRKFINS